MVPDQHNSELSHLDLILFEFLRDYEPLHGNQMGEVVYFENHMVFETICNRGYAS
jgi:hypothetical protein